MGVRSYLSNVWAAIRGGGVSVANEKSSRWRDQQGRYELLRAYRSHPDLYGRLQKELQERGYAGYKNVRNPAHALAELYAYKLPAGTFEALQCPDSLRTFIEQIWESSNWGDRAEVAARDYSITGDLFLKAANDSDSFFQWLDPAHVTDIDEDRKGFVTFCRLDVPQVRRTEDGEEEDYVEIEVWDKEQGYHAVWEHDPKRGSHATRLSDLLESLNSERTGSGVSLVLYEELTDESESPYTGFDFVPIVHRKLRDVGEDRGEGAYEHALPAIDETNEMATRFHDMLFPEVALAFTRGDGPDGASLPPIRLEDEEPEDRIARLEAERQRILEVNGTKAYRLPSGADVKTLIPDVKVKDHLEALEEQIKHVSEEVLPELQYRSLKDQGELSGKAAKFYLADAVDRIGGARRKYDDGLVRVIQMCLSIWKVMEFEGHEQIPEYEDRKSEIYIEEREVFPVSELDKVQERKTQAETYGTAGDVSPELLKDWLIADGFDEQRASAIVTSFGGDGKSPQQRIVDTINRQTAGEDGM